ncbi:MAG: hypothetical protein IPN19_01575 [Elusimicrobia bacterium]|nr:hypothetical protein [Elusimicrobiota bacterium]
MPVFPAVVDWRMSGAALRGRHRGKTVLLRDMLSSAHYTHPVIDIHTAQSVTGLEREACRLAVLRLEKAGALREITLSRRNRPWETVGLFDLLDNLERLLGPLNRTPKRTRR